MKNSNRRGRARRIAEAEARVERLPKRAALARRDDGAAHPLYLRSADDSTDCIRGNAASVPSVKTPQARVISLALLARSIKMT
jgi:hypothetical protein